MSAPVNGRLEEPSPVVVVVLTTAGGTDEVKGSPDVGGGVLTPVTVGGVET